jgi:hypothetical protein
MGKNFDLDDALSLHSRVDNNSFFKGRFAIFHTNLAESSAFIDLYLSPSHDPRCQNV